MEAGYRTFDHTGDLGLEVWAPTPERLFALAAEALHAQIALASGDATDVRLELELEGDDPADLLVHWLNTTLLEAEVRRTVWVRVTVGALGPRGMRAVLEGQRLAAGHVRLREIKAVSHHHLDLALEPPDCRCRLVLDL